MKMVVQRRCTVAALDETPTAAAALVAASVNNNVL